MRLLVVFWISVAACAQVVAQGQQHPFHREAFTTETPMVHDPVMAFEDGTYYLFATGRGIQQMTSKDRKTWTAKAEPLLTVMPQWTRDSVPGFDDHVWAPDVIRWHGRWWLAYSCSTFGRNGSAIGLMSNVTLDGRFPWRDDGCIICSHAVCLATLNSSRMLAKLIWQVFHHLKC